MMSTSKDIIIVGHPDTMRGRGRTYSIAGATEAGKKWLKKHFQGLGMGIMGRTVHQLGKNRVLPFVRSVLKSDRLTYRTVEL